MFLGASMNLAYSTKDKAPRNTSKTGLYFTEKLYFAGVILCFGSHEFCGRWIWLLRDLCPSSPRRPFAFCSLPGLAHLLAHFFGKHAYLLF